MKEFYVRGELTVMILKKALPHFYQAIGSFLTDAGLMKLKPVGWVPLGGLRGACCGAGLRYPGAGGGAHPAALPAA